ncbi:hypothetical protein BDW59DRAFT_117918 [Aspergillus cavernicola]|uniref:Uncharacterized protein n=1 Tax=Aspergillus cavernicola TaxID=176166 RepID=A0ABR4HXL8_9EURO
MASTEINTSSGGPPNPSPSDSASQLQPTKPESASQPNTNTQAQSYLGLKANFAYDPKGPFTVNYDQEVYLQLMAGDEGSSGAGAGAGPGMKAGSGMKKCKTPTQIYREKWVRRALNPAISDPRGDPSPIDFECAENQRVRDKI